MNQQNLKIKKKHLFLVLTFFLLLNFATSGGHLYSIDDVWYFLHTESLVLNQSTLLDPNSPNALKLTDEEMLKYNQARQSRRQGIERNEDTPLIPYQTDASLLLPFLATPLYYVAALTNSNPVNVLGYFPNSIILSLISLTIFLTGLHYFRSARISFVLSLCFLVTTYVWAYNTGMMLRPLAALLVILGFYFMITSKNELFRPIFAGIFTGLGFNYIFTSFSIVWNF